MIERSRPSCVRPLSRRGRQQTQPSDSDSLVPREDEAVWPARPGVETVKPLGISQIRAYAGHRQAGVAVFGATAVSRVGRPSRTGTSPCLGRPPTLCGSAMVAMLFGIFALVVGACFTVWGMQRQPDVAILKALGASNGMLVGDAVGPAALVLLAGIGVGVGLTALFAALLGTALPFILSPLTTVRPASAMVVLGLAGAAIARRSVTHGVAVVHDDRRSAVPSAGARGHR